MEDFVKQQQKHARRQRRAAEHQTRDAQRTQESSRLMSSTVSYGPNTSVRVGGLSSPNGSVSFQGRIVNKGGVVLGTASNTTATGSTTTNHYYHGSSGDHHHLRAPKMHDVDTDTDADDSDSSDEGRAPSKHPKGKRAGSRSNYANEILGSRTVNYYGVPSSQERGTKSRKKAHRQPATQKTVETVRGESPNTSTDGVVGLESVGAPTAASSVPDDLVDTLLGSFADGMPSPGRGFTEASDISGQNAYKTQSTCEDRSTQKKPSSRWGIFGSWFGNAQSSRWGLGTWTDSGERSNDVEGAPSNFSVESRSERILTPASGASVQDHDDYES